jgi:hypothetical protein
MERTLVDARDPEIAHAQDGFAFLLIEVRDCRRSLITGR